VNAKPQWILPLRKSTASSESRLLVFPYAASGASALRPVATLLDDSVEVLGAMLPGRERRFGESPRTSVPEVIRELAADLRGRPALPTYLLGHSLGASLALAFAVTEPDLCDGLVASSRLPDIRISEDVVGRTDQEILDFLGSAGNTKSELLSDPYWRGRLVELFREDARLDAEAQVFGRGRPLERDVLVLGGADDPYVDASRLGAWAARTTGRCRVEVLPGGHFYIAEPRNTATVAGLCQDFLRSAAPVR
jgi:surfactin synthase thioesterase subunit